MPLTIVVSIVTVANQPNKLADAELILDGSLTGFRLTGFQLWRSEVHDGQVNVTFPARPYGKGGFFTFLWPLPGADMTIMDTLKSALREAYRAEAARRKDTRSGVAAPSSPLPPARSTPQAKPTPRLAGPRPPRKADPSGHPVTVLPPGPVRPEPTRGGVVSMLDALTGIAGGAARAEKTAALALKLAAERDAEAAAASAVPIDAPVAPETSPAPTPATPPRAPVFGRAVRRKPAKRRQTARKGVRR